MNSFNMDKYKNSTILAGYIHDLILQNINYNLSSFVLVRDNPYNTIFFRQTLIMLIRLPLDPS